MALYTRHIADMQDVVIQNLQGHINNIARAYALQAAAPPTPSESENNSENEVAQELPGTPNSGLSLSDSD